MTMVDESVLRDPVRRAAADRACRVAPNLPMPLDAIARLAARLLGAPTGVVTFVGADEEHFAGMYGVPPRLAATRHAPMAYSVCKYVVSADRPVSCDDLTADEDPHVRGHPLATEFGLRSFLGVPLRDTHDRPVGSLSVLDTEARHWSAEQLSTLAEIAGLLGPIPGDPAAGPQTVADLDPGALLDSLQEAFIAIDVDGMVVGWNAAARHLLGFTAEQVCGRPLRDTLRPDYGGRPVDEALARLFSAPAAHRRTRQVNLRHRDGHRIPATVSLSLVRGPAGALACAFVTDLSAQVVAEDDAEQQHSFLAALLDSLAVGVVACDADGRVRVVNRSIRRIEGLPETGELSAEHLARGLATLHHPDSTPMASEQTPLMRAHRGAIVRDVDLMIRAPGRRKRLFAANAQPIRGAGDRHLGAVVALHEVTGMRRAERFQTCHAEVLHIMAESATPVEAAPAILESIGTALDWPHVELWLLDELTDTLHLTGHWTASGERIDDLIGNPVVKGVGITGTVWATRARMWVPDITDTPQLATEETLARAEACARRGLRSVLAVPVQDGDTMFGVLTSYADTTEVHKDLLTVLLDGVAAQIGQFVALHRAQQLAHQLTRAKDDFLTLIGHEMRTPLTTITAYATMLTEDAVALDEDQRHMVTTIGRKTAALRDIIDTLLDLAGLESGNLALDIGDIDAAGLVDAAVTAAWPAAAANQVQLRTHLPRRLDLEGDAPRLRQIVDHLLANAIAYSPGGDVRIRLAEEHGVVELEISDNGIGVPAEEQDQVFNRFHRAGNVRHQGFAGQGLGLSLSRAIAERHGGTITLTAREPTGTAVRVRLPQHPTASINA